MRFWSWARLSGLIRIGDAVDMTDPIARMFAPKSRTLTQGDASRNPHRPNKESPEARHARLRDAEKHAGLTP
jgi:hypothetical protein